MKQIWMQLALTAWVVSAIASSALAAPVENLRDGLYGTEDRLQCGLRVTLDHANLTVYFEAAQNPKYPNIPCRNGGLVYSMKYQSAESETASEPEFSGGTRCEAKIIAANVFIQECYIKNANGDGVELASRYLFTQ